MFPDEEKKKPIANQPVRYFYIICLLGEEPAKLSVEIPRQYFWLTFTFIAGNSQLAYYNTINPNKDIVVHSDFTRYIVIEY